MPDPTPAAVAHAARLFAASPEILASVLGILETLAGEIAGAREDTTERYVCNQCGEELPGTHDQGTYASPCIIARSAAILRALEVLGRNDAGGG